MRLSDLADNYRKHEGDDQKEIFEPNPMVHYTEMAILASVKNLGDDDLKKLREAGL